MLGGVAGGGSNATLTLYRHILRAATRFPSKNRGSIVAEIKSEFREARLETDAGEVQKKIALAKDGLDRMRAFYADRSGRFPQRFGPVRLRDESAPLAVAAAGADSGRSESR